MESKGAVKAAEGSRWEAEAKASCKPPKMSPSCDRYGPMIASIHFFPATCSLLETKRVEMIHEKVLVRPHSEPSERDQAFHCSKLRR
jgi:hypothetical protein